MVFQFELMDVDGGEAASGNEHPWKLTDIKNTDPLADRFGRQGVEQPVLEQPRPTRVVSRFGCTKDEESVCGRPKCWLSAST